jgi:small multidrug resistance family-3 protein
MWMKLGRSPLWILAGVLSLALFAALLARTDSAYTGRAFAAYRGVYIATSLGWLAVEQRTMPGPWDIAGACIIITGPKFS